MSEHITNERPEWVVIHEYMKSSYLERNKAVFYDSELKPLMDSERATYGVQNQIDNAISAMVNAEMVYIQVDVFCPDGHRFIEFRSLHGDRAMGFIGSDPQGFVYRDEKLNMEECEECQPNLTILEYERSAIEEFEVAHRYVVSNWLRELWKEQGVPDAKLCARGARMCEEVAS